MAIIVCSECGKPVSNQAQVCPFCGSPMANTGGKPNVNQGYANQQSAYPNTPPPQQGYNPQYQPQYGAPYPPQYAAQYPPQYAAQYPPRYGAMPQQAYYDVIPQPGFAKAIIMFFSNSFNFSGRARRSELWYPFMFVNIIVIILGILNLATDTPELMYASMFFQLFCFFPMISVSVRRLHDRGYVGFLAWLYFILYWAINFMSIMGKDIQRDEVLSIIFSCLSIVITVLSIVFLIIFCKDSVRESNKYGRSPKYVPKSA